MHKKIPVLYLYANVTWSPNDFFKKTISMMVKIIGDPDTLQAKKDCLKQLDKDYNLYSLSLHSLHSILYTLHSLHSTLSTLYTLLNEDCSRVQELYLQVTIWMVRMESKFKAEVQKILNTRIYLLQDGLRLAYRVGDLFKEIVGLHLTMSAPLKSSQVSFLCKLVELLKAIQATFHKTSSVIGESISFMIQHMSFQIQKLFLPIKVPLFC
jgi:hypothetical protein